MQNWIPKISTTASILALFLALPTTATSQRVLTALQTNIELDLLPGIGVDTLDIYVWTDYTPSTYGGTTLDINFDNTQTQFASCPTPPLGAQTDIAAVNSAADEQCFNDCVTAIGDFSACFGACQIPDPYGEYDCEVTSPTSVRLLTTASLSALGETVTASTGAFSQDYTIDGLQIGNTEETKSHLGRLIFNDVVSSAAKSQGANGNWTPDSTGFLVFTTENDSEGLGRTINICDDGECVFVESSLPVELVAFDAVSDGESVVLNWSTATEENNAGFSIEHARGEAEEFAELAFVEGNGTTLQEQSYSFVASGLDIGTHKFRLRQIDFDGAFEYSEVVEATIELAGTHRLGAAYPNPFNPSTTFELVVGQDQVVQIDVINALGQRVIRLFDGPMEANEPKNFVFEARTLPSGLYFYRVAGEGFAETKQMMLVK